MYTSHDRFIRLRRLGGDVYVAKAEHETYATRIALALTLVDEASDAELASLVEAGAGNAMVKAYRKEHDHMAREVAETSGMDAARVGAK